MNKTQSILAATAAALMLTGTAQAEDRSVITDATTTAAVKSRLLWNSETHGTDIKVKTENGTVTLSGTVASATERDLAAQLAENTRGVERVRNDIRVDGSSDNGNERGAAEAVTDTWITTKVKSSLLMASNVEGRAIEVTTRDGKVKLSGEVESSTERELAVEIAKGIRGVHDVDASNLEARDGRQAARGSL